MGAPANVIVRSDLTCLKTTRKTVMRLLTAIAHYQERVRKFVQAKYADFAPGQHAAEALIQDGESLWRESNTLVQTAGKESDDCMEQVAAELISCLRASQEMSLGLRVSLRIVQIDNSFQRAQEAHAACTHDVALKLMKELEDLIYGGATEVARLLQKCACYEGIKTKYQQNLTALQTEIQTHFESLVKIESRLYTTSKSVTLSISKDSVKVKQATINAFSSSNKQFAFCNSLLENFFKPLIQKPVSLRLSADSPDCSVLTLSYALQDVPVHEKLRPTYKQVLAQLTQLLSFLNELNAVVNAETHVLTMIGEQIESRTLTLLVDECLLHAVPQSLPEIEHSSLLADVEHFAQMLTDLHFIKPAAENALSEFMKDFDTNCRAAFNKRVLEAARTLMQQDLQNMAPTGSEQDAASDVQQRYCISKSTLAYVQLLECVITQSDTVNYLQDSVSLLLNAYITELPGKHKRLLESIPQQSALFYNNCMYLANWLAEQPDVCLPDVVSALQAASRLYLDAQVEQQRQILADNLASLDIGRNSANPHTLGPVPLKLIRRCMRQLELLSNVWLNVLPEEIYVQAFCCLVDDFLEKFISAVIAMEDISAAISSELSHMIQEILANISKFFHTPADVRQGSSRWLKLEQLEFILNSSLKEIVNMWQDSTPDRGLSRNYTAEELKRLVRAAFQNTEHRARALMAIGS